MKPSIMSKLEALSERYEEIQNLLSDPSIIGEQHKFRLLSKEYSQLEEVTKCFGFYKQAIDNLEIVLEMAQENDAQMREMAQEEIKITKGEIERLTEELQVLLIPKDPNDERNCYVELRAGAGGDEAGLFVGDLFRMYSRFAESKGWCIEVISANSSEQGGYKEMIARISGDGAYGALKFESGGHRVQRVPVTESQGRVHTSACTIAILPEIPEAEIPDINPVDLKIDTFRSSGAGGQHVNTTDSAIRITHLPTGTVVECQEERSQHKNKAKAMSVLAARLIKAQEEKRTADQARTRRNLLGSGDRSDRIRTYNYPQGRVSDHRINLTVYCLDDVMAGNLNCLIEPIMQEFQADQLAALAVQH
ncbi:peptide chain release factor 1 [Candidatus Enterovibrio altilux]|uniref:Peptide chain release factor 1 n=1 Tax=Candidatus Enterovibrio altilux TaxID=1927128 RepID=A0A291B6V0_9GAMM|nr:peptide chain release factor 1 [Candidatus Enterovibrio luxaltus]ATF08739.1 Peptide chain release factor 1 [Candidatus Enterovibrio luxaltus]